MSLRDLISMFSSLPKLSLALIAALVNLLAAVLQVAPVGDEIAFRAWMRKVSDAFTAVAALTGNAQDDALAKAFERVVSSDEAWSVFYGLITDMLTRPEGVVLGEADPAVVGLAEVVGIDIATIMMLIELVMKIIEMLRNR